MSKRKRTREYTQISRNVFLQFFFSLLGLFALLTGGFFAMWYLCANYFIWSSTSRLYYVLKALQYLSPFIIILTMIAGILVFTYRAIRKPLNYLDEVIDAAKKLSHPEDAPIELSAELSDVQNELNLAREQSLRNLRAAKEAEQRKNDLIVYLAHDLKTPLTSVIGYLSLLRDEPQISPELRARYTGIALDKAERLEELINEFFDITRFSLTALTLELEQINLSMMAEQIASEFIPVLAEKNLTWDLRLEPGIGIFCDRDKLERVFDNLVRNAVSYSYESTEIQMQLTRAAEGVLLVIKNHGKTIQPEKLAHLFERFFRLDGARTSATGGAGLGLAIAKEIVELHGGRIWAESENECVTFSVLLPDEAASEGKQQAC